MWTPDYFIRFITLPPKVPAAVVCNDDGTFDIYINDLLSDSQRKKALEHEIDHIKEDHFYSLQPVGEIEAHANAVSRGEVCEPQKEQDVPMIPHYLTLRGLTLGELNAAGGLLTFGMKNDTGKIESAFLQALLGNDALVVM